MFKKRILVFTLITGGISAALAAGFYFKHERCAATPVTVYAWKLPSGSIFIAEDPTYQKLQDYFHQEHLDQVLAPHRTDVKRILALAQWASRQFVATSPFPKYPPWNAPVILDRIRHGKTGGFCAQYAFVFGQACQSAGYMVRYLDIASPEDNGGHFTTEIYVPSLKRWIVFEPEWGLYYTDEQGHLLDALELHQWAVGRGKGKVLKLPMKEVTSAQWLRLFYYFRYYLRNNFLSVPVFYENSSSGQMGFEPYRLIWKDSFTNNDLNMSDSIPSSDPQDFEFALHTDAPPQFVWKKRGDFYKAITSVPPYQLCKITFPNHALIRLIKQDFIHNPLYHRLKS